MEFKSLKNIETSFRHLRLFGIVYLCVCTLLVGFSVWKAYSSVKRSSDMRPVTLSSYSRLKIADNSAMRFSAASSSFFLAAFFL